MERHIQNSKQGSLTSAKEDAPGTLAPGSSLHRWYCDGRGPAARGAASSWIQTLALVDIALGTTPRLREQTDRCNNGKAPSHAYLDPVRGPCTGHTASAGSVPVCGLVPGDWEIYQLQQHPLNRAGLIELILLYAMLAI